MGTLISIAWSAVLLLAADLPPPTGEPVDFARDVRPIFESRCYSCHGPRRQRSGFRLDARDAARKGGELGVAIVPGKSAESPLIRYVAGTDDALRMPPEGDLLSADQVGKLRRWVDDGAQWPDALAGDESGLTGDLWSLCPIDRPAIPVIVSDDSTWVRTPVDAFIAARLRQEGLSPSPEADRRTLIRRLTFDLHGLPPTPEEVDQFLQDDQPDAYERLVDRLLAGKRYGERWARHWLDVAHYADSHGQDQDRPRPNAWPYRDYLIRFWNADRPYSRFVTDQVAGDVLYPSEPASITATGFLAAGPWDESGLRDIREDSIDRLIGHYLDRDDMVCTTMSSFVGLTVGCARCHDHKFDPITQEDYYSLQAVFAGIDKAERLYDVDPAVAAARTGLQNQLEKIRGWQGKVEQELLSDERQREVAAFESSRSEVAEDWTVLEPATCRGKQGSILKALLDRSILAVGTRPDKDTYVITGHITLPQITGLRLDVLTDETLPHQGPGRQDNGNLHLSAIRIQVQEKKPGENPVPVSATIRYAAADFDQAGWGVERAIDTDSATAWGIYPAVGKAHQAVFEFESPLIVEPGSEVAVELDQLHGGGHLIGRFRLSATATALPLSANHLPVPSAIREVSAVPAAERTAAHKAEVARWLLERQVSRELAGLPRESRVYCGTNRFVADGTFRPAATPRAVHVLARGDVSRPGAVAQPGTIPIVSELSARFSLSDPGNEGERRAALAQWLADSQNPLTWRVIVNRVWHYHFGRGIVATPSDFGRMGEAPSHPELLDWLAAEFRDGDQSLKQLHRTLVLSATYRQSSTHRTLQSIDADNRFLWRMNRRRLDAESLRDALLLVSGQLDDVMYGPPVKHFVMKPGVHVTPEADYEQFDVNSPEMARRSIYRFVFRTRPDPLLDVFDCPDASQSAPVRGASLSALQALSLWNNKFPLRQAEQLARLARGEVGLDNERQVKRIVNRVLCREPTAGELEEWTSYATRHGLENLCRVLLNSSEFLFID